MTDLLDEALLSRALRAVADAAVPDAAVPAFSGVTSRVAEEHLDREDVDVRRVRSASRHRLGRGLGAVVAVLALGGAGTGIAAAAGAFGTESMQLVAPAIGRILPTGRWTAADMTTRISEPGPDGSTLTLETASADAAGGCMRLVVSARRSAPSEGPVSCALSYDPGRPPTTRTPTSNAYGTAARDWTSPAGIPWRFVYGRSQTPSAVEVGAVSRTGTVLATAPISNGWFVLPVRTAGDATQRTAGRHLVYYGPTGRQLRVYPTL